jgi:Leishmanolysin
MAAINAIEEIKKMKGYETYIATANAAAFAASATGGATADVTTSPFTIEVRFMGGLTTGQKNAFKTAADRWTQIIVGDLPSVMVDGELIDDIVIQAQGSAIDGPGAILGQAGPTRLRPPNAGTAAFLPAKGKMAFDTADLAKMETNGTLTDVITHEMGHVLGIGTVWSLKKLLKGAGTANPTFTGKEAKKEFGKLRMPPSGATPVPLENTGGAGTRDSHWRETVFNNELMSGFIAAPGNPISRMTVASLQDIGYTVDLNAAEPYNLPNLMALAEEGMLEHTSLVDGKILPNIPLILPEDSLQT